MDQLPDCQVRSDLQRSEEARGDLRRGGAGRGGGGGSGETASGQMPCAPICSATAFTGVPAEVELAAMRDAMQAQGLVADAVKAANALPDIRPEAVARGRALLESGPLGAAAGRLAHATRADLLRRLGRAADAVDAYDRALALATNPAERAFLTRRREELA